MISIRLWSDSSVFSEPILMISLSILVKNISSTLLPLIGHVTYWLKKCSDKRARHDLCISENPSDFKVVVSQLIAGKLQSPTPPPPPPPPHPPAPSKLFCHLLLPQGVFTLQDVCGCALELFGISSLLVESRNRHPLSLRDLVWGRKVDFCSSVISGCVWYMINIRDINLMCYFLFNHNY